jgi:hypothetical protein
MILYVAPQSMLLYIAHMLPVLLYSTFSNNICSEYFTLGSKSWFSGYGLLLSITILLSVDRIYIHICWLF